MSSQGLKAINPKQKAYKSMPDELVKNVGTAAGASLLLGRVTRANGFAGVDGPLIEGGNCCGTVVVCKTPQFWPWRSIDPMRASKTSISTKPRKTAGL